MERFALRALVAAAGLWLAEEALDGLRFDSGISLLLAALVLGLLNATVRPVAVILTLPITLVTLGLFILVLNAGILALAAALLPGFHVDGFWTAFFGALIVSLVSWVGSWFIGPRGRLQVTIHRDGSFRD
jgi:putative membrane protein